MKAVRERKRWKETERKGERDYEMHTERKYLMGGMWREEG